MDKHATLLGQAPSTGLQLKASRAAASSLDRYSVRVRRVGLEYIRNGETLASGLAGWSKWIEQSRPSKSAFGDNFSEALREIGDNLHRSNGQLSHFILTTNNAKGASSVLDAALDRHTQAWREVLDTNRNIQLV